MHKITTNIKSNLSSNKARKFSSRVVSWDSWEFDKNVKVPIGVAPCNEKKNVCQKSWVQLQIFSVIIIKKWPNLKTSIKCTVLTHKFSIWRSLLPEWLNSLLTVFRSQLNVLRAMNKIYFKFSILSWSQTNLNFFSLFLSYLVSRVRVEYYVNENTFKERLQLYFIKNQRSSEYHKILKQIVKNAGKTLQFMVVTETNK